MKVKVKVSGKGKPLGIRYKLLKEDYTKEIELCTCPELNGVISINGNLVTVIDIIVAEDNVYIRINAGGRGCVKNWFEELFIADNTD